MIKAELTDDNRPTIALVRDSEASAGAWAHLQLSFARGVVGGDARTLRLRAEVFLSELSAVRDVRTRFGERVQLGPNLLQQLASLAADKKARESVAMHPEVGDLGQLAKELSDAGFVRGLKPFQLENLDRLMRLPHGADFSVPGAGKTTVALANFALQRHRGAIDRLLVVAPLAAFEAWKVDSVDSFASPPTISVHRGSSTPVHDGAQILLTNYNRLASDYESIRAFSAGGRTQVVLDEAHRMKRGAAGVHGSAALDLAFSAVRRDILTGTPAPQGAGDLIALMQFLYPGQDRSILPADAYYDDLGRDPEVVKATSSALSRFFVRTTKSLLNIPDPKWQIVRCQMGPVQSAIYAALIGEYRGQFSLSTDSRRDFGRLGRITMYLLEAATNPSLLTAGSDSDDESGFSHPPLSLKGNEALGVLLSHYSEYEYPWKYQYLRDVVSDAAERGEKVLIWTTFVRNIRALERELSPWAPAVVHGGIQPEDGAAPGAVTREAELQRFKSDPACSVLIANPAAAGEGISLHHWCHHAIYLDRTFNAGQFLQSQDRIHRLGLKPDIETRFTLLLSEHSIDDAVDGRLREKVGALAVLMNDPGLVRVALPESDEFDVDAPVEPDDSAALINHIIGQ